jgi:putative transcriptional regulator
MVALNDAGLISTASLQEYDEQFRLQVAALSSGEIKRIRTSTQLSREEFAMCLNVSSSTVGSWERGEHCPSGPALKLLTLVRDQGIEILRVNDDSTGGWFDDESVTDDYMANRDQPEVQE